MTHFLTSKQACRHANKYMILQIRNIKSMVEGNCRQRDGNQDSNFSNLLKIVAFCKKCLCLISILTPSPSYCYLGQWTTIWLFDSFEMFVRTSHMPVLCFRVIYHFINIFRQMDGWTNGRMNGQMNRQSDFKDSEFISQPVYTFYVLCSDSLHAEKG